MERTLTETVLNPGEDFHWLDANAVRNLMATQWCSAAPIYQAQDDEEIAYLVCTNDTSKETFQAFTIGIHTPFIDRPWREKGHPDHQKMADIAMARVNISHPRRNHQSHVQYARTIKEDYANIWREMRYINNHRFDRPNRAPPGTKVPPAVPHAEVNTQSPKEQKKSHTKWQCTPGNTAPPAVPHAGTTNQSPKRRNESPTRWQRTPPKQRRESPNKWQCTPPKWEPNQYNPPELC